MAQKPLSNETEEVTLKRAHIHRGEAYKPGDKVRMRPDQAKRLKARKVAE